MHSQHSVHRDRSAATHSCDDPGDPDRGQVAWLDCWAGGPHVQTRGPAYDLACFAMPWPDGWSADEQRLFLTTYRAERTAQGHPVGDWARFLNAIARERRRRAPREARRPGGPSVTLDWSPPE
ncbi:MAG: hypothetical protein R3E96_09865 [Planctomycetota bacterium]